MIITKSFICNNIETNYSNIAYSLVLTHSCLLTRAYSLDSLTITHSLTHSLTHSVTHYYSLLPTHYYSLTTNILFMLLTGLIPSPVILPPLEDLLSSENSQKILFLNSRLSALNETLPIGCGHDQFAPRTATSKDVIISIAFWR